MADKASLRKNGGKWVRQQERYSGKPVKRENVQIEAQMREPTCRAEVHPRAWELLIEGSPRQFHVPQSLGQVCIPSEELGEIPNLVDLLLYTIRQTTEHHPSQCMSVAHGPTVTHDAVLVEGRVLLGVLKSPKEHLKRPKEHAPRGPQMLVMLAHLPRNNPLML